MLAWLSIPDAVSESEPELESALESELGLALSEVRLTWIILPSSPDSSLFGSVSAGFWLEGYGT